MNIVIDFIVKGIIGGTGQVIAKSIANVISIGLSNKMVAQIMISLAEVLAKRTKNDIDDKLVATWKDDVIKSGIDIK